MYPSVIHELAGHPSYGYGRHTPGQQILEGALAMGPDDAATTKPSNFMKYGYAETEMFAELYGWNFDTELDPLSWTHDYAAIPS